MHEILREIRNNKTGNLSNKTQIGFAICSLLESIIENNELVEKNNKNNQNSSFFCQSSPCVSLKDYMKRIIKFMKLEESSLVLAVIYIHRLIGMSDIVICLNNIHK
jgi:hypothetical protein